MVAHASDGLSIIEEWYLDSGCTMHMTGKKVYIEKLGPRHESFVTFGDGTKRKIKVIGILINHDFPYLEDVLLAERLNSNLIIIS